MDVVRKLFREGNLDEALERLKKIKLELNPNFNHGSDFFYLRILESQIIIRKGEFDKAQEILTSIKESALPQDDTLIKVKLINAEVEIDKRIGNFEEGIKKIYEAEILIGEIEILDLEWKDALASLLTSKGTISYYLGQNQVSIDSLKKAFEIREELGDDERTAAAMNNYGLTLKNLGQYYEAIDLLSASLLVFKKIGNKAKSAITLLNIGLSYVESGDVRNALLALRKALLFVDDIEEDKYLIAIIYQNMGTCYTQFGEYESAIACHLHSLNIKNKIDNPQALCATYANLGSIYWLKGDLTLAHKILSKSVDIASNNALPREEIYCLYYLMIVNLDLYNKIDAEKCLLRLRSKKTDIDLPESKILIHAADGLYEKSLGQLSGYSKALSIFKQIINDPAISLDQYGFLILQICDCLLQQYWETKDRTLIAEIDKTINDLDTYARDRGIYMTLIDVLMIKAKWEVLREKYSKARKSLDEALKLAQSKGMLKYEINIGILMQTLSKTIEKRIEDSNSKQIKYPLMDSSMISNLFSTGLGMRFKKSDLNPEEPMALFITLKDRNARNNIVYSAIFTEKIQFSDELILTLVNTKDNKPFGFLEETSTDEIVTLARFGMIAKRYENSNIKIHYVFIGNSYIAKLKLKTLVDQHHLLPSPEKIETKMDGSKDKNTEAFSLYLSRLFTLSKIDPQVFQLENKLEINFRSSQVKHQTDPNLTEMVISYSHPIRYLILNILYNYDSILRSDLKRLLGLSSSRLEKHLNKLTKDKLIESTLIFYEEKPRKIIVASELGWRLLDQINIISPIIDQKNS